MQDIEEFLTKYKEEYDYGRTDPGLMYDLMERWYGPRQVNR